MARIAIIGAGISGNACGLLLSSDHELTVYEAADYVGGHANTVRVNAFRREFEVDTGFMVFNDRTYPNFCRLMQRLGVQDQPSDMSLSVRCDRTGLEFQGSDLNGLFAQRRNLVSPRFYRMLADILRFNREATEFVEQNDDSMTLGEFVESRGYSQFMVDQYLVPMGAAIWSACPKGFLDFPAHFLLGFFRNHGLLQIVDRPRWKTIAGRSQSYVEQMTAGFQDRIRLSTPVTSVSRHEDHVVVQSRSQDGSTNTEVYDHVIFATHSDITLRMLTDATDKEREILGHFDYQENTATVHTDVTVLPRRKRAWASWNYHVPRDHSQNVRVTYDVNRLQALGAPAPICVTLNDPGEIRREHILAEMNYQHPVFSAGAIESQRRHGEISGVARTHFCGAYWGYGFHEDGVNSALAGAKSFGKDIDSCIAASITAQSDIGEPLP